jgi:hypothetical protein
MMVYTVTVRVDSLVVDDFLEWAQPHIRHVLDTGCFTTASVEMIIEPASDLQMFVIKYTFETLKDFKRYETDHAPALRKEGLVRFGDHVSIERTIGDYLTFLVHREPTEPASDT